MAKVFNYDQQGQETITETKSIDNPSKHLPGVKLTFEEWVEKYEPLENILVPDAPHCNFMFETYGNELDLVKQKDNNKVWTLLDDNNTIFPGYHIANRLGYFITLKPWEDDTLEVIINEEES